MRKEGKKASDNPCQIHQANTTMKQTHTTTRNIGKTTRNSSRPYISA